MNNITVIRVEKATDFYYHNGEVDPFNAGVFNRLKANEIVIQLGGELHVDGDGGELVKGKAQFALNHNAAAYIITQLLLVVPREVLNQNGIEVVIKPKGQDEYEF